MIIALLFVADGPRDAAVVPHLVEGVLGAAVTAEFRAWKSLRLNGRGGAKGYARKLAFAARVARDAELRGLVATVDTDTAEKGRRLRELKDAVTADRLRSPALPTALGEATPHLEAWLLDDAVAVRRVLQLDEEIAFPTVRRVKSPKEALNDLMASSSRGEDELMVILGQMASAVDASRCAHMGETGFKAFVDEVRYELLPLVA